MLRIRIDTALEAALDRSARLRLREWKKTDPGYRARLSEQLTVRPLGISRADYYRFRLLHRQFGGTGIFGLAHAVRVGRSALRSAKTLARLARRVEEETP